MKKLFVMLSVVLFSVASASAARVEHYSNSCPPGSALSFYRVYLVFSDEGCPVSAAGVDCDGRGWHVNFGLQGGNNPEPGGPNVPVTWVQSINPNSLEVVSTGEVDFRIINLKTGEYTGIVYHVNGSGHVVNVDISGFESSLYGIVVYQDERSVSLTTFSK